MKNKAWWVWIRILMLSSVFFMLINFFGYLLNANESQKEMNSAQNIEKFTSKDIDVVGSVWVALSTNLGTRFQDFRQVPIGLYRDVFSIGEIIANQNEVKDKIISRHMIYLNEYLNVLKTDVRWLLSGSTDRAAVLNAFIAQLEYRQKVANENLKVLEAQRSELLGVFNNTERELAQIRTKMENDFGGFNSNETLTNIDLYLEIRQENTFARTYIVFINKFISYYDALNKYNNSLLTTLVNNKDIIIKNSQIVIPNSGTQILRELELLYNEEEWKR